MSRKKEEELNEILEEFIMSLVMNRGKNFVELTKIIYKKGMWSKNFLKRVFVSIKKKKNSIRYEDFRTITLISHA